MKPNVDFVPFTPEGYLHITATAADAGYRMVPVCEAMAKTDDRVMLLRHDVDVSIKVALEMAELEAVHNLRSTYFILLYNDLYNPLSKVGRTIVRRIADLGHEIGLHWDSSLYPSDLEASRQSFQRDLEILSDVVGAEVVSASQHDPIGTDRPDVRDLVTFETYSEPIASHFEYVSDSNMTWRSATPLDLIKKGLNVHFLAHPIWWVAPGDGICEKVARAVGDNTLLVQQSGLEYSDYLLECLESREELDREFKYKTKGRASKNQEA